MSNPTYLKKYETALDNIIKQSDRIKMLQDCQNSQNASDSFDENLSCFKLDGNSTYKYSGTGYSLYDHENAYNILNSITPTGKPHGPGNEKGISYHDIFKKFANDGYTTNIGDFSKFERDITDLSGALHRSADFRPDIQQNYKNINDLRSELDNKMRDIYNPDYEDEYILHNQSVYMTLSWTILATTVLYYLFVKL